MDVSGCTRLRRRLSTRLASLAVLVALVAACDGSGGGGDEAAGVWTGALFTATPVPVPSQPQTVEAAQALLDKALGRGLAGDHAGAWDLFVPEDQGLIDRADYVAYQETCNADAPYGVPYEISDIRLEEPATAVAVVKVLGFSFPVHAFYREGQWLTQLSDENREGVEEWITSRTCLPDP